jgi:hypothetical protein
MNERIRELAEQALGVKRDGPTVWQFYDDELNKFAELIVRECARVANDSNQSKNRAVGVSVGDVVKNHFGVE